MRPGFIILLSLIAAGQMLNAQVVVSPSDTTACPDTEVFLHAEYDHCILTSCYFGEDIPFDWITDPGADIPLDDNDHAGPYSIGFDFCFFGETYDQFWVCDNGWISFSPPTNAMSNNAFPDGPLPDNAASVPKNAIFAAWRDLFAAGGTSSVQYFTTGIPGYRKTYIKFAEMQHPYCDDAIISYFEIVLHETENYIDNVFYQIELCDAVDEFSILGVQNNSGTIAFTAPGKNFTEWDALSESFRWKPNDVRWVLDGDTVAYGPDMSFFPAVSTDVIAIINACDGTVYSDTVHVHVPDYFDPEIEVTDNLCYGENNGAIDITFPAGTSGYELSWSTGETTEDLNDLESGYYILTISDADGCENEFSIYVDEPTQLIISPTGISNETCEGATDGSLTISAFGGITPYLFSINGGEFISENLYENLPAGDYDVVVMDANGCTYETVFTIEEGNTFTTDISAVSPIYEGQTTTISIFSDGVISSVTLTPDGILDCPLEPCMEFTGNLTETTTFLAEITLESGCVVYDSVTVEVIPINQLVFPNAFSPNSDGVNDFFQTVSSYYIAQFDLTIYNRYGEIVFQSSDPAYDSGWDGVLDGEDQPVGTYVWQAMVRFQNGIEWNGLGNVVLVR